MPVCCRCNGSGRCNNCSCSKAGKLCVDCLPIRRGRCNNVSPSINSPAQLHCQSSQPGTNISCSSSARSNGQQQTRRSSRNEIQHEASNYRSVDDERMFNVVYVLPYRSLEHQMSRSLRGVTLSGAEMMIDINNAYVTWRRNVFLIPSGKAGKAFVVEIARLIRSYAEASTLESIALKAVVVMQALLLQKPHTRSKAREHSEHLSRRLDLWRSGDISSLVREGCATCI